MLFLIVKRSNVIIDFYLFNVGWDVTRLYGIDQIFDTPTTLNPLKSFSLFKKYIYIYITKKVIDIIFFSFVIIYFGQLNLV